MVYSIPSVIALLYLWFASILKRFTKLLALFYRNILPFWLLLARMALNYFVNLAYSCANFSLSVCSYELSEWKLRYVDPCFLRPNIVFSNEVAFLVGRGSYSFVTFCILFSYLFDFIIRLLKHWILFNFINNKAVRQ